MTDAVNPAKPSQWPLAVLGEADAADVRALFGRVFGLPMSEALQHWKYGGGRGMAVGLRNGQGALVAHYAGTLRAWVAGAGMLTAAQIGDVMVAPEVRDVFARMGPFGRVAQRFIETFLGDAGVARFGFGFPNARAMRLGQRLGLYWPMDRMGALAWPAGWQPAVPEAWSGARWVPMDWTDGTALEALDALAQHHHAETARGMLTPLRDAGWWRHRFANHPEHAHTVLVVHGPGGVGPVAALVLRRLPDGQPWELLDWLAVPEAHAAVLPWAARAVAACGGAGLTLWASSGVLARLPAAQVEAADRHVACELATTHELVLGQPASNWAGHVWMTGGDTDFR